VKAMEKQKEQSPTEQTPSSSTPNESPPVNPAPNPATINRRSQRNRNQVDYKIRSGTRHPTRDRKFCNRNLHGPLKYNRYPTDSVRGQSNDRPKTHGMQMGILTEEIPGQDFDQTFAPVMRLDSLRNLIAIDGDLDETIYMQQPEGFSDGTPRVCLLVHSLKELGYQQLNADHCVYIRQPDHGVYDIFSTWVDDFALFCTEGRMAQNKKEIGDKWEITDQGEDPRVIVGIQITRDKALHRITIHQGAYIQRILERAATEDNLFEHPTICGSNLEPICLRNQKCRNHLRWRRRPHRHPCCWLF